MADRYWVGGTATWDATAGTKWAATSGGAGGQSVPTSADDVYFNAASGAVTCTVGGFQGCASLDFTGFAGTISSSAFGLSISANLTLSASMTITGASFAWNLDATTTGKTVTSNGKVITGNVAFRGVGGGWTLADALSASGSLTITAGTFTTNNYAVTASSLSSSNSNTRTINLGSSTVTLSGTTPINFSISTGLTLNSGTSNVVLTTGSPTIRGGSGVTFYNVSQTASPTTITLSGANTFNNLSIAARTTAGIAAFLISANQAINGTLTLSAGTNATMRTFVQSDILGTTRTLTCAAVASLTDIDFRDITIAGAAAPVSGTLLGDCKGNSGITFDAAKTVYWASNSGAQWNDSTTPRWSNAIGGSTNNIYFPLAQDTAIITSSQPTSGATITINAAYNIGTIDMSARTTNTMTLATGSNSPAIYGNWINGTGTRLTGTGNVTFTGRNTQAVTSAGISFTWPLYVNSPQGSVVLQDAITFNTGGVSLSIISGTFSANTYNVTMGTSGSGVDATGILSKTINVGSGTWSISGTSPWSASSTNFTVTGTGTISLTSASAKTFSGGGVSYSGITLNQGGAGTLTITGNNKFANITNTAIGRVQFTGGTTNEFAAFNLAGVSGNLLQLGSTNTTQAILKRPGNWNVGSTSVDAGNNTGLSFT